MAVASAETMGIRYSVCDRQISNRMRLACKALGGCWTSWNAKDVRLGSAANHSAGKLGQGATWRRSVCQNSTHGDAHQPTKPAPLNQSASIRLTLRMHACGDVRRAAYSTRSFR